MTGELNPRHIYQRTGVCDVGTYTVDLALDDDGEFIDSYSGSIESGVYTAQERIAAALEADYRQKMPFKIVEEVLRTGCFRASGDYLALLAQHGITVSMSRHGDCFDNAMMESFWGTLKAECATAPFPTRAAARLAIFDYLEVWYNRQRLHSALDYTSPASFERQHVLPFR